MKNITIEIVSIPTVKCVHCGEIVPTILPDDTKGIMEEGCSIYFGTALDVYESIIGYVLGYKPEKGKYILLDIDELRKIYGIVSDIEPDWCSSAISVAFERTLHEVEEVQKMCFLCIDWEEENG